MVTREATRTTQPNVTTAKPLVLIVRSEHLKYAQNADERDALLQQLHDVVHARDVLITLAAAIYAPVNIYADGLTKEFCDGYVNPLVDTFVHKFREVTGGNPNAFIGIPPADMFRTGMLAAADYYSVESMLKAIPGEYHRPGGLKTGFNLSQFEIDAFALMLATVKYYGMDIKVCPSEKDESSLDERAEAHRQNNKHLIGLTNNLLDLNLYARVAGDLTGSGRRGIVYLGNAHELEPFRVTPLLEVDWIDVKRENGRVVVDGTLPYRQSATSDAVVRMRQSVTAELQKTISTGVIVNLTLRPSANFT